MDTATLKSDLAKVQDLLGKLESVVAREAQAKVISVLEKQIISSLQASEPAKPASSPKPSSSQTTLLPTIKLSNYAWDQSDNFVKIYLPLKGIQNHPTSNVETTFTSNSFEVMVSDLGGKNYTITMKDLLEEIDPASSLVKHKTDDLLVMLKKTKSAKKWEELTKAAYLEKEKKKPKMDAGKGGDPQDGLMSIMKQMYEEGDDEMKRSIRKAWHEGQSKKTGDGMF